MEIINREDAETFLQSEPSEADINRLTVAELRVVGEVIGVPLEPSMRKEGLQGLVKGA